MFLKVCVYDKEARKIALVSYFAGCNCKQKTNKLRLLSPFGISSYSHLPSAWFPKLHFLLGKHNSVWHRLKTISISSLQCLWRTRTKRKIAWERFEYSFLFLIFKEKNGWIRNEVGENYGPGTEMRGERKKMRDKMPVLYPSVKSGCISWTILFPALKVLLLCRS